MFFFPLALNVSVTPIRFKNDVAKVHSPGGQKRLEKQTRFTVHIGYKSIAILLTAVPCSAASSVIG
jgi:hypothetical protein